MMVLLVTLALCVGAIGYVAAPFVRRREQEPANGIEIADSLAERREANYTALRDLAFEHELGNLTAEDYLALRDRYARQAVALMKVTEARDYDATAAVEAAVETLRAARRREMVGSAGQRGLPALKATARRTRWLVATGSAAGFFAIGAVALTVTLNRAATEQRPVATLPTQAVRGLVFSPVVRNEFLLSTPDALLASADGGKTWSAQPARGTFGPLVASGVPGSAAHLWLADRDAVLESDDGGRSFSVAGHPVAGQGVRALTVHPSNPMYLYAAIENGSVVRSVDGGNTWSALPGRPEPSSAGTNTLALLPSGRGVLFAGSLTAGIAATYDDGKTWAPTNGFVNGLLPTKSVRTLVYDPASGDRFEAPSGAVLHGAMYAGTDVGLFKSIDGGTSWQSLPLRAAITAVAVDPLDSRTIAAVDDRGRLFMSHDHGERWAP